MPSLTAASIPAAISGALPSSPTPDVGTGAVVLMYARGATPERPPGRPRRHAGVAGRDPGDMRRVDEFSGSNGFEAWTQLGVRRREGPCDDDLGGRVGGLPFGKPAGVEKAASIEERVGLVDTVVDDPDLLAVPRRRGRFPRGRRADIPGVRASRVAEATFGADAPRRPGRGRARGAPLGHDHREAVQDDRSASAPAPGSARSIRCSRSRCLAPSPRGTRPRSRRADIRRAARAARVSARL